MFEIQQELEAVHGVPLEFEIELLQVQPAKTYEREPWEMEPGEKYLAVPQIKDKGGELFRKGDYKGALKEYERALQLLDSLNTCICSLT